MGHCITYLALLSVNFAMIPSLDNNDLTVSVGLAPFASHFKTFSSSNFTVAGVVNGF
jgi:hypothetical protein